MALFCRSQGKHNYWLGTNFNDIEGVEEPRHPVFPEYSISDPELSEYSATL